MHYDFFLINDYSKHTTSDKVARIILTHTDYVKQII